MAAPLLTTAIAYRGRPHLAWAGGEFKAGSGICWHVIADAASVSGLDPASTGRPYTLYESAWIAAAGVLGQQRVRRLHLLGRFLPETLFELALDYEDFSQSRVGLGTDTKNQIVEFEVRQPQCMALKFRVSDFVRLVVARVEVTTDKGVYRRGNVVAG